MKRNTAVPTLTDLVLCFGAAMLVVCAAALSPVQAATPIPLTTPAGVCQFQATKVTAVAGAFSAQGEWGPGCPGYVAPTPQPPAGTVDCTAATPPTGLTRLSRVAVGSANLDATKLAAIYGAWPGLAGPKTFVIPRSTYLALEFSVPEGTSPQTLHKFASLFTGTSATFSMSVSTCPGDFRSLAQQAKGCGLSGNSEGNLGAVVDYASGNRCNLRAGQRYYLNVIHAPLGASSASSCKASTCSATVKNGPGQ